ncbi:hypothetical protein ACFODZ_02420 [Marinicella sediminis]|uniref:Secreted protein n=1 Tax=Marinicella sediminis TaxID=1792834 RepID=A0ABV7J7K7_9GAMM|nr:hypothetical protein [Marinicella sediminis]
MNLSWLTLLLAGVSDQPTEEAVIAQPVETISATAQPDLELLMFLGEWSDDASDQWLDPTTLIEDNELTRELDKEHPNEEHKPDHN